MVRKQLSQFELGRIVTMLEEGYSFSAVGRAFGRSHTAISKVWKKYA